jgi:hypothetical protein
MRLIRILEDASSSARRASAEAAFAAFFCESFSARFWASTERAERFCSMASGGTLTALRLLSGHVRSNRQDCRGNG